MKRILVALALMASPAIAADVTITAGGTTLLGVALGGTDDQVVDQLTAVLGKPTEDTGRIAGCELNGVDERYVSWGGLTAQFEANEADQMVFMRWVYQLDYDTGKAMPGGPAPADIILPKGIMVGDPFSKAARVYGFEPKVDDVFGVAMQFMDDFGIMTRDPDVNAPISEVGVPGFAFCE